MNNLLFFKPIPRSAIWGKTVVKDYFRYDDFEYGIGQTWTFSDQKNGSNICISDNYQGLTLHQIWKEHSELFNSRFELLPVIISLVGPSEDLSVQLHPDSTAAKKMGFPFGKNEAWYFIETHDSSLVYGHTAKNTEELVERVRKQDWNGLFNKYPINEGDFVYIPAGTVHALGKNNIVYEVQQSTDLTYRIYDYDRTDSLGNKRDLHLEKAIEVLGQGVGKKDLELNSSKQIIKKDGLGLEQFISNDSFTILKLTNTNVGHLTKNGYWLCTVIEGSGQVNGEEINFGDNFIIPANTNDLNLVGNFKIMITCEEGF